MYDNYDTGVSGGLSYWGISELSCIGNGVITYVQTYMWTLKAPGA